MIKDFLNRADSRRYSMSQHELERRWNAVRGKMAAMGIDYLVMQSQQRAVGGYFRWFTDLPGGNYPNAAVFALDGDMTIISHGPASPALPANPPDWALRGGKSKLNTPAFPNVWWEDAWDANKIVEIILKKKPRKVGLVGLGNMSAALYENLKEGLKGIEVINATGLVDEVRMVKSEEELNLHREAAYMHEMSYKIAKQAVRPGRTVTEVMQTIQFAQIEAASEEQQIAISFAPADGPPSLQWNWGNTYIRRKLQQGDIVNLLIESSAAGGYWYDLRRFLCIGPVPQDIIEAREIALEARSTMAENCKPGLLPKVALEASNEFLKRKGYSPEARVAGHGQGLDLVERPVFLEEETAELEAGMVVCLHPTVRMKYLRVSLADTYVITDKGAVPLYWPLFDDNEIVVVG